MNATTKLALLVAIIFLSSPAAREVRGVLVHVGNGYALPH
ncbi:hypothetical protein Nizo2259_2492 [Lactiplantibacillus plantarum]|uniref:Uncharacterized protein n=2 Tax=Lactiplantibacillus plantarum TaxID=1590 RepID=A0A162GC24_LACPN|nr:3-oxoacyl-[acyl-carrier-protein] reductase [Lactiplantibacillus plantarum ST-III]AOG31371.1 3-oxoacyl-ACP reductase [Lactiplantibacillus plantarum]AUV71561.1 3-oxoacyl-ACP reductase [Lactiplantibacillus plantarum subsp. plantarum]EFK30321.1 hypothetical protein HMPREF0531_10743 [Lactiplantibacillus plantarum subsp. plantarum ATCC 14917 = JCM 1149 = CGMCC 1.2437]ERO42312.1 3-oxoacyl-[acyl-carrier-protein] reductase [Lactiplantibacillus plantarum WJL]MCS6091398.1 3-oxoacyl-ACP reductase [Lact